VDRLYEVRAVVKIYEYRWAIETTFEHMKSELHLDEFMVWPWVAIERLLWVGAMAYILPGVLCLEAHEEGRHFLAEALRLLWRWAVMGKRPTVGKPVRPLSSIALFTLKDGWLPSRKPPEGYLETGDTVLHKF